LTELEKDNPIRHSYRIFLKDLSKGDKTEQDLSALPNIAKIRRNEYVANNIISMKNIFSIVALAFFILLFAISLFIIYNTIRLAMVARKKEINIMKFVGATNSFIRWPFIIEGLIIGAIAASIAYFVQWYIYTYFVDQVFKGINIIKLVNFSDISGLLTALFYITGMLVGVVGSVLAIRKYLDV
jgi:cell division transport system permease protein